MVVVLKKITTDSKFEGKNGCIRKIEPTAWLIAVREAMMEMNSSTCSSIGGNCLDGAQHLAKVDTQFLECTAALSTE